MQVGFALVRERIGGHDQFRAPRNPSPPCYSWPAVFRLPVMELCLDRSLRGYEKYCGASTQTMLQHCVGRRAGRRLGTVISAHSAPFLLREIGPQEVSVCNADAKWKVVRSAISEPLLPTPGQSLVPIVCGQECNHTSDGSLNE
jgi:hypothetical protein